MQRLKEITENGPLIHADDPNEGDRTLCGYAFEGSCCDGDTGVIEVDRGEINCRSCLAIIYHSKAIPNRFLAKRR
jgi:hypothetical protein